MGRMLWGRKKRRPDINIRPNFDKTPNWFALT
jgi:hypothetical protein